MPPKSGNRVGYDHAATYTGGKKAMPPGEGSRFSSLEAQLAREKGVRDPQALAASIGKKKWGAARMAGWAKKG